MFELECVVRAFIPGSFKGNDGKDVVWNNLLVQFANGKVCKLPTTVAESEFRTGEKHLLNVEINVDRELRPKLKVVAVV